MSNILEQLAEEGKLIPCNGQILLQRIYPTEATTGLILKNVMKRNITNVVSHRVAAIAPPTIEGVDYKNVPEDFPVKVGDQVTVRHASWDHLKGEETDWVFAYWEDLTGVYRKTPYSGPEDFQPLNTRVLLRGIRPGEGSGSKILTDHVKLTGANAAFHEVVSAAPGVPMEPGEKCFHISVTHDEFPHLVTPEGKVGDAILVPYSEIRGKWK